MLACLTMAFHTNLFGGITHYASGQGALYFGSGQGFSHESHISLSRLLSAHLEPLLHTYL